MSSTWAQMRYLNPYEIHKRLINQYILKKPGDTSILARDTSNDRNDLDVIRENHKFLWEESDNTDSWELQFAKKYYDKLFKEYCIGDLSFYKENKIALRWRTEKEVVVGKGQFICGNKKCLEKVDLHSWEVNFAYVEHGSKKNSLVKIRLCLDCSKKLNYHSKKREVKRLKRSTDKSKTYISNLNNTCDSEEPSTSSKFDENNKQSNSVTIVSEDKNCESEDTCADDEKLWENHQQIEPKSRDEEMEEYLQDLLL